MVVEDVSPDVVDTLAVVLETAGVVLTEGVVAAGVVTTEGVVEELAPVVVDDVAPVVVEEV